MMFTTFSICFYSFFHCQKKEWGRNFKKMFSKYF